MPHIHHGRNALEHFIGDAVAKRIRPVLFRKNVNQGQALIEFALMIPLLLVLVVNAVNFGGFIYGWIGVADGARAGAQYGVLAGASINGPSQTSTANIQTLVTNETSSLPGASSSNPVVKVCTNSTTTDIAPSASCPSGLKADPEAPEYVSLGIDVTYTYPPFVPALSYPLFGIILPSTTIRRHTLMRMLQ